MSGTSRNVNHVYSNLGSLADALQLHVPQKLLFAEVKLLPVFGL